MYVMNEVNDDAKKKKEDAYRLDACPIKNTIPRRTKPIATEEKKGRFKLSYVVIIFNSRT